MRINAQEILEPLKVFRELEADSSIRTRMLRTFLPLTVAIVVTQGLFYEILTEISNVNHALIATVFILIFVPITAALVIQTARSISRTVDTVEVERRRSKAELEQRFQEMKLLNEMGELLQSCVSVQEAYEVIAHASNLLLPADLGALYIITASKTLVEQVSPLSAPAQAMEPLFMPDQCWGLRRGRTYLVDQVRTGLVCEHVKRQQVHEALPGSYLCVPIIAHSEILGILHLQSRAEGAYPEKKQQLVMSMVERIALALASLKLRETLQHQAVHDPLTGLYNRRYLTEALERELHRAGRKVYQIGVVMLDLDHFKDVNDVHGHDIGDAYLHAFGHFLQTHVRGEDIVCRHGGDEFIVIIPETTLEEAQVRAEELREGITHLTVQHQDHTYGDFTASLGVSSFPRNGETADQVLQAADAALYQAKTGGRNRVVIAPGEKEPPTPKMKGLYYPNNSAAPVL